MHFKCPTLNGYFSVDVHSLPQISMHVKGISFDKPITKDLGITGKTSYFLALNISIFQASIRYKHQNTTKKRECCRIQDNHNVLT